MKTKINAFCIAIAVMFMAFIFSNTADAQTHQGHVMVAAEQVQWIDGPASLPPGAKMAVLSGDPASKGLFTIRAKFPAGYMVPAHWHPTDESITVISGKFKMGLGANFDRNSLMPMSLGGFAVMPAKTNHFAAADEETIIQLHAMGPFEINYVNPADDPRKMQARNKK
jgi:quercetin dioxygenase-like cupin family protein